MDPHLTLALNTVLLVVLLVASILLTIVSASRSSSSARADRFSQRVRLPYGTTATRESVTRRVRANSLATSITMIAMTLAAAPLLLTPVATSVTFMFVLTLMILVATGLVSTVAGIRERLFHPAPDAPRIARARALRTTDYLSPFRRLLPWALAALAAVAVAALAVRWTRSPAEVDPAFGSTAMFSATLTVAALVAMPFLERRVLDQPQPASDTLELAWDDALRTTTLGSVRLTVSIAAWMTLALAVGAAWLGSDALFGSFAQQVPTWGVIALSFVYPSTGGRLRSHLYPDWLRQPLVQGNPA